MGKSEFGVRPPCFSSTEWKSWKQCASIAPPPKKHGFCYDCTPAYQEEMIFADKCKHPGVRFFASDEGIVGKRDAHQGFGNQESIA